MAKRAKKKKATEAPKVSEISEAPEEEGDDILMSNESFEDEFDPEDTFEKLPEPKPEPEPPTAAPSPTPVDAPPPELVRGEYVTKHAHVYLIKPECYKEAGCKKVIIPKRQA